jgi:hypothetical protein
VEGLNLLAAGARRRRREAAHGGRHA